MTEAVAMLVPVRPGDALFLISDGQDTKFKLSTDKVDRMLVDAGVRLFALVPVEPGPQPPEQNGGAAAMLRFVKATGGDMAMLNEPEQMASALPVALAQALHFYQVRLRLSHSITKSTSFELEFTKSARQRRRDTHLVYPEAMRACSP